MKPPCAVSSRGGLSGSLGLLQAAPELSVLWTRTDHGCFSGRLSANSIFVHKSVFPSASCFLPRGWIFMLFYKDFKGLMLSPLTCHFLILVSFLFLKFILFIYLFLAACGLSLVVASGGYSLLWCTGFSLRWLLLLRSTGSRRVGFSSCGSRALEHRLSSCGARA